ncbi:MAG: CBS domain-containing protein [Nitrospira sp.]|jgi:CBS domain-containing protein|nr:CBS domain-containing protein [Nitrospira sp. BO4]
MPKRVRTGLTRSDILDRYVERFKQQLVKFQPFLSRKRGSASLEDFDETAEELIGQVFGAASDESEAYLLAKTGESALLPEEAQESGTHNVERESLQQRRQVLESCLADLELRRRVQATRKAKGVGQALVADYMSHEVRSIHREASIKQAGQMLQKHKVGSLIVDDGSRYIGIITDSDVTRKAVAKGLDPNSTTVATCMSRSIVTIEEDESLADAMSLMKKQGIRHLPVTADATIIGVLSVSDLLRALEAQISS